MIVIPYPDETAERLAFEAGPDRTPGLHVSDVIQSMLKQMDEKRYADGRFEPNARIFYLETGFALEDCIERAMNRRRIDIVRPPELQLGGMYLSPDGFDPVEWCNDEIKWTSKSSRGCPHGLKFWGWIMQFKCYCKALTEYVGSPVTDTKLRVWFARGDWDRATGMKPTYGVWLLKFTQQEIDQAWRAVLRHADEEGMR